ncbi:MAG: AbrB/MazE/SpoVT family DNA-binding domain-containing protein [Desulfurococcales archaeon ex4484_58]|nr:MAG: AbrB/MazE/SpoVT family DNA-binding domain-containing protein [Desulfurococcales archaeon ex4484_58]
MVKLGIKVKGQIIILKVLREAYGIKEGGYVIIELCDDKLVIRGIEESRDIIEWTKKRKVKV